MRVGGLYLVPTSRKLEGSTSSATTVVCNKGEKIPFTTVHFVQRGPESSYTMPASRTLIYLGPHQGNQMVLKRCIDTSGGSHTNLLVSVWHARVSLPMCSIEWHALDRRCLRGVTIYTYTSGLPTNSGMLPASIFDVLACSALAAHVRRGSDNPISMRLYRKHFAGDHTFFKARTTIEHCIPILSI